MKPGGATSVFTIDIKPIIAELARTEVCFPNIQLLVDKIVVQPLLKSESPRGAFRLWLTDGERAIQGMSNRGLYDRDSADSYLALVKRRLYKRLITGDIREGSYVLLKEYTVERADKINGEGEVMSDVPGPKSEYIYLTSYQIPCAQEFLCNRRGRQREARHA